MNSVRSFPRLSVPDPVASIARRRWWRQLPGKKFSWRKEVFQSFSPRRLNPRWRSQRHGDDEEEEDKDGELLSPFFHGHG